MGLSPELRRRSLGGARARGLAESCVAAVLSYLDPPQICRLAGLNQTFRAASSADFVWDSKLPSNYEDVIGAVFGEKEIFPKGFCKKDIYAVLCRTNTLDGGTKKVWLDKTTGKTCMLISSNGLAITGIDDRRYWTHVSTEESRFRSMAYLQQIWWLEVYGEVEFPFPVGSYSLFFRLKLGRELMRFGRRLCNPEHVHGWDKKPVRFHLSTCNGQLATRQSYLEGPGKWIIYHVGDFVVENCYKLMRVKFWMTQIDCTHTKGGLCVDSVVVYPVGRKRVGRF
ncbi:F-box family protein [Striga asiatica]|uniref:F-box family protein n=1 Tax=Striga asiatica TaxID=4170 RepID=A0A5A7Q5J4_STRAF|nr:F-box family protein [Striga asiatica]